MPINRPIHQSNHTHAPVDVLQRPFLSIVARVVPACMLVGAGMELFMLNTGFCKCTALHARVCVQAGRRLLVM